MKLELYGFHKMSILSPWAKMWHWFSNIWRNGWNMCNVHEIWVSKQSEIGLN